MLQRAVFLDRDGVLVKDIDLLHREEDIELFEDAASGVRALNASGWSVVVISNQPVVARGIASEAQVEGVNRAIAEMLAKKGARLDAFYWCPHHPAAEVERYRVECDCRKPAPGLLLKAAAELGLNCEASVMVGDRMSDVLAGHRAGCRTILLETGRHADVPIESSAWDQECPPPDRICNTLSEAVEQILRA